MHIHFLLGDIAYVTSSYFPGLSLGDFLLKEGKISMQIHEESLAKIRGTNIKQGTYLVEKGYLSPHDLIETLNAQVLEKLFWLFEWEEGDFYFKESEIIQEELRLVKIEMQKLIYQGVRDHLPLNSLPTEFKGRKESILFRRPSLHFRLDSLGLGPIDMRILSFVNGQYTLRQVVALARLKKRAIYKILYGLFLSGVICFPEGLTATMKDTSGETPAATPVPVAGKENFEISVSTDLIAEAVKSIDRIHDEIQTVPPPEVDTTAPTMPPTQPPMEVADEAPTQPPVEPPSREDVSGTLDELGYKLDEVLSSDASPNIDEQFGFDDSSPDGFAAGSFEEQMDGVTTGPEEVAPDEPMGGYGDYGYGESEELQDTIMEEPDQEYAEEEYEEEEGTDFAIDINDFSDPDEVKKQGIILLEEGRFDDAEAFLNRAVELLPEDFELYAYLGWAIYNSPNDYGNNFDRAEETIKSGMGPGKSSYLHFLHLGKLYVEEGQNEFAELHFIKSLELNVDCAEAREQVKRIHSK